MPRSPIAALILAAGSARRFGSDKRLYPIDGVPMLARTLGVYRSVFAEVGVVIRPGEPAIATLVEEGAGRVIEAPDAALGQSRSLAAGVQAMRRAAGLFVGLGDMPFVAASTLRHLVRSMRAQRDRIVRPRYDAHPGNPIGFPRSSFEALLRIEGDQGAREIVAASDVWFVDVPDPGVVKDIDRAPTAS